MKRALTLRKIQLLESFKYGSYFTLFLLLLGLVIDFFLKAPGSGFIFSTMPDIYDLAVIFMLFVYFLSFLIPIFDGLSYYDSALRLGISRRYYFLINIPIYLIIAGLSLYLNKFGDIATTDSSANLFQLAFQSLNWQDYFIVLAKMLFYAILSYSFYKIGWKILIPLILVPIISGLSTMILTSEQFQLLDINKLMNIFNFVTDHLTEIYLSASLILIGIYYGFTQKFEVQN